MTERVMMIEDIEVPRFLYGTAWKEDETAACVTKALEAGFRGIDTANQRKHYHEAQVGEALQAAYAEGVVEREDVFVQTKFTFQAGQDHRLPYDPEASIAEQVRQSCDKSLEHLQTDVLDSLVLHGPSQRRGLGEADREAWRAMEALHQDGKVRLLGVSNVAPEQLTTLCEFAEVEPACVQNRCFAQMKWGEQVRAICEVRGITYQGFSLLTANRNELNHERVQEMARHKGLTVPQLIFRFALQLGILPLTGTTDPKHMRQDLAAFEADALSDKEVETLLNISRRA